MLCRAFIFKFHLLISFRCLSSIKPEMNSKIRILFLTVLFCVPASLHSQSIGPTFYYHEQEPVFLHVSSEAVVVRVDGTLSDQLRESGIKDAVGSSFEEVLETPVEDVLVVRLKNVTSESQVSPLLFALSSTAGIRIAVPALKPHPKSPVSQFVADRFVVQFGAEVPAMEAEQIIVSEGAQIVKTLRNDGLYLLSAEPGINALEAANRFVENHGVVVQFAEPDFMYEGLTAATVNDPLHGSQWAHVNTGQSQDTDGGQGPFGFPTTVSGNPGADMDVDLAWDAATGSGILVAILDSGVDLDHPDLQGNIVSGGWDAAESDFVANDDDNLGEGGHGTACAGIAAAIGNNNLGVAGVAYNAQILPIRIFGDNGVSASSSAIAGAIDTAWTRGADVLSNSWGGGSVSGAINAAFSRAKTNGRSGLGCVILVASGNGDIHSGSDYPASLATVISIGASNNFDEKKNPGSGDGQFWWGGNYGADLDVSAPTICYTTDIGGSAGYEPGDYTASFNGTSCSTPNVAGVSALVLSANSTLTSNQVQTILESTADKAGVYPYDVNGTNGPFNVRFGYGRVNAHAAVRAALSADYTPPAVVFTPLASTSSSAPQQLSATITDGSGIASGGNQPRLFYRTNTGSGFGSWLSVVDGDGPAGDVYDFVIPGQPNQTGIEYYVAAKDQSAQANTGSFPIGASDSASVGDKAPVNRFRFWVSHMIGDVVASTDVPKTITSAGPTVVQSTLNVDSAWTILDVNVTMTISHTYDSDLKIILTSPSGTSVCLASDLGGTGDNFTGTVLDDEASLLLVNGSPPFSNTFQPEYPLSVLDGESTSGIWTLTIYDQFQFDGGSLNSWSLSFTRQGPVVAANAIVANEFLVNPTVNEDREFVEFFNTSNNAVSLANWKFLNTAVSPAQVTISSSNTVDGSGANTSVEPGSFWIICRNRSRAQFQSDFGVTLASEVIFTNAGGTELLENSSPKNFRLRNSLDVLQDSVSYGASHVVETANAWQLKDPSEDNANASDTTRWAERPGTTAGSKNVLWETLVPAAVSSLNLFANPDTTITLSWSNPADVDFTGSVVVRRNGSLSPAVPARHKTYAAGDTVAPGDTVVYVGADSVITDSLNLVWGDVYYYRVFSYDEVRNYSSASANGDIPLPVELAFFSAEPGEGVVVLHWRSESEVGNAHWIIQRRFGNDEAFEQIGVVDGQGTKPAATDYQFLDRNADGPGLYYYRLADVSFTGAIRFHPEIAVQVVLPTRFALHRNYPNPFNPSTTLKYALAADSHVRLAIYNVLGQEIKQLVDEPQKAGFYKTVWDGKNRYGHGISSGLYIYRIVAEAEGGSVFVKTRKMMLLR